MRRDLAAAVNTLLYLDLTVKTLPDNVYFHTSVGSFQ